MKFLITPLQFFQGYRLAGPFPAEIQQQSVADKSCQRKRPGVHTGAVMMIWKLNVSATVARHMNVLEYVPGIFVHLVLWIKIVGIVSLQAQAILLFARIQLMRQIDNSTANHALLLVRYVTIGHRAIRYSYDKLVFPI